MILSDWSLHLREDVLSKGFSEGSENRWIT